MKKVEIIGMSIFLVLASAFFLAVVADSFSSAHIGWVGTTEDLHVQWSTGRNALPVNGLSEQAYLYVRGVPNTWTPGKMVVYTTGSDGVKTIRTFFGDNQIWPQ